MSVASAQAKAARAAATIAAKGSKVLLRHDPRTVDPETGALAGSAVVDYSIYGVVEGLALGAGKDQLLQGGSPGVIQAGDVKVTVPAVSLPSRPTPSGWSIYIGGTDLTAWPVPGAAGVERLVVIDASDVVQESGVSFIYQLHCRR